MGSKGVTAAIVALFMGLVGCGDKGAPPQPASSNVSSPVVEQPSTASAAQVPASPPTTSSQGSTQSPVFAEKPDTNTPESQYKLIDGNLSLLYIYYAFSAMPVDYELFARQVSQEYRSTTDGFKKQEIMAAIKPKIDSKLQETQASRYFKLKTDLSLGHYNFDTKLFPVNGITEGLYITYTNVMDYSEQVAASFSNSAEFTGYREENIEKAKEIEALVSQGKASGKATMFLFVRDTDSATRKNVKFEILKIEMKDRNEKVFAIL